MLGRHDFRAFTARRAGVLKDAVRDLWRCDLRRDAGCLVVTLEGGGFLYKMCRGIVGTLVQVGEGRIAVDAIPGILGGRDRRRAGMNAPAHGLVLQRVFYQPRRL
jgi:tRNA pseudouridine38-40 synthase